MPDTPPTSIQKPVGNSPSANRGYDDTDEYRPEPAPPPAVPAWQDGSVRVGIHTSIAGNITSALEIAHGLGANALQIFSTSPRMWPQGRSARIPAEDATRFRARRAELGLGPLVVHANYLINLASPERVLRVRSIQAFADEIVRCLDLAADFLVVHPGSVRDGDRQRGIRDVGEAVRQSARGLKLGTLRILLENTAGQGSSLGWRMEELGALLDACAGMAVGACLDTAHLLAAGYDIRTQEGLEATLQAVQRHVGLDRVHVMHVNDSKVKLGARVDRHEHIGKGHIGLKAFARMLNHPVLVASHATQDGRGQARRAYILETPIDKPGDDLRNVRALWALVGGQPGAEVQPRRKAARVQRKKTKRSRKSRK